ncbi:MAG: molybdopterin synthase sulfur carrier subunit [Rhodospirillaceae bacterium]|nr:molybdopterin synthase sulfur carrier subunit [Rhodospirillaceae bacterium]|tara:strand:- start:696 stop:947 length:252 start_codon:yes stop_codon:yes gene_type:complete
MVKVILTESLAKKYTSGETQITIEANTIQKLFVNLNERYPGINKALNHEGISVVIDGEIFQDALYERLEGVSEICFIPRIGGG